MIFYVYLFVRSSSKAYTDKKLQCPFWRNHLKFLQKAFAHTVHLFLIFQMWNFHSVMPVLQPVWLHSLSVYFSSVASVLWCPYQVTCAAVHATAFALNATLQVASQWQHRAWSFPLHPPCNATHETRQAKSTGDQSSVYTSYGLTGNSAIVGRFSDPFQKRTLLDRRHGLHFAVYSRKRCCHTLTLFGHVCANWGCVFTLFLVYANDLLL